MPEEILLLSPIGILFLFAIKEFFAYLKSKKNGSNTYEKDIALIRQDLSNHITTFCKDLDMCRKDIDQIKTDIHEMKISIVKIIAKLK